MCRGAMSMGGRLRHLCDAGSAKKFSVVLIDPLSRNLELKIRTYVRFVCEPSHRDWDTRLLRPITGLCYPILRTR